MLPCACVTFTRDCTHDIGDCPRLNAGQRVTLHISLGFVSSQRQDWTLDLISDISSCTLGINSSLVEGRVQRRRKAVDKTKLRRRQRPQQQILDSLSKCNRQHWHCCLLHLL